MCSLGDIVMAFSRASIKYKPLRVGFLARSGHLEDLRKAAGMNSLLWGGIYNPIIPVTSGNTTTFAEQLIDLFSVDLLYPLGPAPEIDALMEKYRFLRDSANIASNIFYEDWKSKKQVIGLLDSKDIVDISWEKGHKDKPAGYESTFRLLKWDEGDPLANVLSLQFGFFPSEPDLKWDYATIFVKGLHAREHMLPLGAPLPCEPRNNFGPLDLTGAELKGYGGGFPWGGDGIYIGDSDSFDDLLTFWNLRAAGNSVVYLAKDEMERSLPCAEAYLAFLASLPNRHPNIEDKVTLYHQLDDEVLGKSLRERLMGGKGVIWHKITEHSWNGLNIQPAYQVFTWQSATLHVERSYERYAVHVELPDKTFLVSRDDSKVARQHMGVIIHAYGDFGHPGYTLKLPPVRALNEFYSREIAVDPWALRVEREGFSHIISATDESIDLYPLSKQLLVEKIFEVAGLRAQTSQPGLIARKIIEKIGGLEDARVLKIKGVRKILQNYAADDSISRSEATKIIYENDFAKHHGLYIEAREAPDLTSSAVFDYLLKKDFFRAGLELVCVHCRLPSWLTLRNIDDAWVCEYCGGQNQTSTQLKSRGDWRFRKSGLFAKDNNQEGAIPVLLTLLTLGRILDHADFTYSTALTLHGQGITCETDLAVLNYGRRDQFEVGVGECKSDGGSINADDCRKLKEVASRLAKVTGTAAAYIVFAKTSDGFRPDELTLFRELAADVDLILFTNRELELYHPYWLDDGQTEDVPEKYPHSLADLATNSAARYLK
jgi:hypothetical protein